MLSGKVMSRVVETATWECEGLTFASQKTIEWANAFLSLPLPEKANLFIRQSRDNVIFACAFPQSAKTTSCKRKEVELTIQQALEEGGLKPGTVAVRKPFGRVRLHERALGSFLYGRS